MRRSLVIVPLVLSTMILLALVVFADPPLQARQAGQAWEYGSLELVSTGRGVAYVFSQFTAEGRTEEELDLRPNSAPPFPPMTTDRARGNADAAAARSIARLGREGWELITETRFARYGNDDRVLMFKRPVR